MKAKLYVLLTLLCLTAWQVQAQKNRCKIEYDVEILEMEADPMAMAMMQDMKMTLAFQGRKARVDMDMGMMTMVAIMDEQAKQGITLMDMMGMKIAQKMGEGKFMQQQNQANNSVRETGETKTIAGYTCHQAFVSAAGTEEELEMWFAKEIVVDNVSSEYTFKGMKGLPLEMYANENGTKMRMTAIKVETAAMPEAYFSLEIPEGYTLQEEEEAELGDQ